MSLFGAIGGVLGGLAKSGVVRGTLGKIFGGGARKAKQLPLPGMGAKGGLPAIRGLKPKQLKRLQRLGGAAAAGIGGGLLIDAAGNLIAGDDARPKRRRMNYCNDKALRRALRRIEGYDRQRKRVDKALRKACPPQRRRSAPRQAARYISPPHE